MTESRFSPQRLLDLHYPDFAARHIFTAKLRLVILGGFWLLCSFYYPGLMTLDQPIILIISLTFVVTTICYGFILKGIGSVFFFVLELAADVAAQTVLVYLTGGVRSNFFTIYIIYCAAGGLFYNWRTSTVIAILATLFYSGLVLATQAGWIGVFSYPFLEAGLIRLSAPVQNWTLLIIFLLVGIYGVRISSHFTKLREKALEDKNRELTALNRVSSTTRSVLTTERITSEVLRNLREGLGYSAALMLLSDPETGRVRVVADPFVPETGKAEEILGFPLNDIYLPEGDTTNPVYQAMHQRKVVIRYELAEIAKGAVPSVSRPKAEEIQRRLGFKKFLAAPLVAEGKLLGALVGITREPWVEEEAIRAFEGFADQTALVIDNALLITELKRKNEELERVSRIKSEFLATMSHELRTPLTAIIGFSELLLEEVMGDLAAEQKESLREVLENGENLLHLINGLLDLAKIEAGRMELSVGPVNLADLVERVQRMIGSLVQKKGHVLEIRLPESMPIVYVDERKMQQVLINLLSNAIKFTPEGGRIAIEAAYFERPDPTWRGRLAEGSRVTDGSLMVTVTDTGMGIREGDLETVFEAFRQADSSFTREHHGTGLGLALSKEFVELHGGGIWVESQWGQGTRFTLVVPDARPAASDVAEV